MDIQLFEKLMLINEAVATADPQKVMKDYYKGKSTKLSLSTWPSAEEENQYKFWLLQDGTVIPVEYSHNKTLADAAVEDEEMLGHTWDSFVETGAVLGYFSLAADEMGIISGKRLTQKQISALKNLYLEYKVRMPDVDIAEMISDWQAMAEELQTNTAREWFEKQKVVRWHFSEHQEELIDKLLKVFE